jgi:arsenate reductase
LNAGPSRGQRHGTVIFIQSAGLYKNGGESRLPYTFSFYSPWQPTAMTSIYHNPRCGTSRTVLQTLQEHGHQPEIIEYLATPLSRDQLAALIAAAGLTVREAIRSKEPLYQELKLDDPALDDEQLLQAMARHPVLMNRPFVTTEKGTRLCRPAETIDEII